MWLHTGVNGGTVLDSACSPISIIREVLYDYNYEPDYEQEGYAPDVKIVIVKLSAVGDVVHALPVLHALRAARPDAYIAWAVQPGAANLLEGHPELNEVIVLPRNIKSFAGLREAAGMLRRDWDYSIDLQGLTKSGLAAYVSGARIRIGFRGAACRELNMFFNNTRILPSATNVIHMNLELLREFGIVVPPAVAILHSTPDDDERIAGWAREVGIRKRDSNDRKLLLLDPFAGWPSKLWERHNWVNLAINAQRQLSLRPVVFWGPREEENAQTLAQAIREAGGDPLVVPTLTLREYVALARDYVSAVVAGDTGPMHIAAALGIPCVALYGPSDSRRNSPDFANARYRALQDFSQPCAGTFTRKCAHHAPGQCMSTISVDSVVETLTALLHVGE